MDILRKMTDSEYAAWIDVLVPEYAADKVAVSRWSKGEAVELARKEYGQLLPKGLETENNYFFTVLNQSGQPVGSLWFGEGQRVGYKVAFVFDLIVRPEYRRQGHARRALQALEIEAAKRGLAGIALHVFGHNAPGRALYEKLGYAPTSINLYKPLSPFEGSDA
jgi:ribosomal protein S18 acetylase RimI-like enzyme